ncbi:hypothetical protein FIU28_16965 [Tardiphaga sp. vice154]|uniref:hypothetical protein n=1 Tax=Tardiphaga sp. vice154 TaxID=2592814 RepID=UPI0011653260|nr:hypothetical protein [Tardiphaga sp. vice154]QDM22652.1 hypothetical protein FIU28_16965 [Tardiphaga sp. vice154]
MIGLMVPLSFANEALATGATGAFASVCLLAGIVAIRPGERAFLHSVAGVPIAIGCLIPLWTIVQMLPLPSIAHPIWAVAAENLGFPVAGSISIDLGTSLQSLLLGLGSLSAGLAAAAAAVDPRRARAIAHTVVASAAVLAIISLTAAGMSSLAIHVDNDNSGAVGAILICLSTCIASLLDQSRPPAGNISLDRPWLRVAALLSATLIGIASVYQLGSARLLLPVATGTASILIIWAARRLGLSAWAAATLWLVVAVIGTATAFASRPYPSFPFVVAFSGIPADHLAATLAMLADVPWAGTGAAAALLPTYLGTPGSPDHLRLATAAAAALISWGPVAFWAMLVITTASVFFMITSAINRGRDWVFCAAAAGALVIFVTTSFVSPISPAISSLVLLGITVGMGVVQSVGRSRS